MLEELMLSNNNLSGYITILSGLSNATKNIPSACKEIAQASSHVKSVEMAEFLPDTN